MFSFFRFRETDDGRSDEDEDPDVKESQDNEDGSGVGFDDYGNDSFEDIAERVEESNGYTVQQVGHSHEEVAESQVELNCDTIQHNFHSLEEGAESKEELKRYTEKQLKVKLAERGLLQMGNKVNLIHRLLDPHPSDFKNNNKTINCNGVENDEDDSRIRFDHVDTDGNSDENGEDNSRIGFDDGDTNSLKEVAESEEESNGYTVA